MILGDHHAIYSKEGLCNKTKQKEASYVSLICITLFNQPMVRLIKIYVLIFEQYDYE